MYDHYSFIGFSDPFSSFTHLIGAVVFLVAGSVSLYCHRGARARLVSLFVYIFGVTFALSMSGVYHILTPETAGRAVLQRLDHAGIFFLIAATFTPVHVILFRGWMRWGFLLLIWATAITGITLKSIFFNSIQEWLGLLFYLGLGWLGIVSGLLLYRRYGWVLVKPLVYGAIAYTAGAVLEFSGYPVLIEGVIGPHDLFHIMVLIGISLHWVFVHRIMLFTETH